MNMRSASTETACAFDSSGFVCSAKYQLTRAPACSPTGPQTRKSLKFLKSMVYAYSASGFLALSLCVQPLC